MDPTQITDIITNISPEQSALNKDLILNFLLAITALAGTIISAFFIKKAGLSLNAFNYIKRKVFRDQNRLGTQLHKNRDKQKLIDLKIKVVNELDKKCKDWKVQIIFNKLKDDSLDFWKSEVKEIIKSPKASRAKNLIGLIDVIASEPLLEQITNRIQNDIYYKFEIDNGDSASFVKFIKLDDDDIAKNIKVAKSSINKNDIAKFIKMDSNDECSDEMAVEVCNTISEKRNMFKVNVLESLFEIDEKLHNKVKKKEIHLIYKALKPLEDNKDTLSIVKSIEEVGIYTINITPKSCKTSINKTTKLNKEITLLTILLAINKIKDRDYNFQPYIQFFKKPTELQQVQIQNNFFNDLKTSIINNPSNDKESRFMGTGEIQNYDFDDVFVAQSKQTFKERIKKLNRKNNQFDFYDLQISDQIQVSRIYKEIMLQKSLTNKGGK